MNGHDKWAPRRAALIITILFLLPLLSCGEKAPRSQDEPSRQMRIISLSPNITEIIYALDAGDWLVGVTSFCNYPPEAKAKPKVGGVLDTNFEAIIGLEPDVVIDLESQAERIAKLQELGLNTFTVANETIQDVFSSIRALGELLNKREEAETLAAELHGRLTEIRRKVADLEKPGVAFVFDHSPGELQDVFVAGSGNFINELLGIAGGYNAFADIGSGYPQVSLEAFVKLDPDFIFDATESPGDPYSELTELKAVRDNHVYFCFGDIIQVPGPRLPQTLEYIATRLHPEAFEESSN